MLQLRDVSRINPEAPAEDHIDSLSIRIIRMEYKLSGVLTVKEFWKRVAMLVGFFGRKSDGNPGWQKIWKGWLKLQDMRRGMELALRQMG